jgi:hypothetical protein
MTFQGIAARKCRDQEKLEQRLACLADAGLPAINDRLAQLECEWSSGRMTKATVGVLIVAGLLLTVTVNAWWLILPAVGGVFLLQYLFMRTSWLGATFREMGFRSGADIDQEKFALRTLRGDFRHLPTVIETENKEDISRLEGEGGIVFEPEDAKPDTRAAVKEVLQAAKS